MRKIKENNIIDTILENLDKKELKRVENKMTVSAIISETLKLRKLSQKDFAEILGKKPSEISRWLSGTHNFTLDSISDIEAILNISLVNKELPKREWVTLENEWVSVKTTNKPMVLHFADKRYSTKISDNSLNKSKKRLETAIS